MRKFFVLKNASRQKSTTAPLILDPADEHKFRRIVPALRDLLIDELPGLGYGEEVEQIFQNGLANTYGSPSKNSVRDINDLIAAIIKRLRRQGKVPDPPVIPGELVQPSSRDEIPYPAKITYAWLKKHVPVSMWLSALATILFVIGTSFSAGMWWVETSYQGDNS